MDLILINGNIHTMNKDLPLSQGLAISKGKIIEVGTSEEVLKLKENNTKVIDLQGKTLVPGFNDSHMHLLSYGYSLTMAGLNGTTSMDEIVETTKAFIQEKSIADGKWVRGRGWNQDYFKGEKLFPTRYDLDKISTSHPICLTRTCGHVLVLNSKALELLKIDKNTPQFPGGEFDLDENKEPLGIFREDAMRPIYNAIPSPNLDEIKDMLFMGSKELNKCGITSIGTDDFEALPQADYQDIIKAYKELIDEGKSSVRIYEQCLISNQDRLEEFLEKGYKTGLGDDKFKIGPLKLLIDGSLGARTAALMEGYTDDPLNTGIVTLSQEYLDKLVKTAHDKDCQVAIHGIGDRGMYMAFDSIEKALHSNPRTNHRHGIVHAQITDDTLFNKFSSLDVLAYIQPIFLDYDWHIVEDRIGPERMKTSYNWKTMQDMGIHIPCGSDAPVEFFNVMHGIYEAVTRKDLKGNPEEGWMIEQALTPYQALYAYTVEGAYASFEEDIKGSIEEGKLADLVLLSHDILSIEHDKIKDIEVLMTICNGQVVYSV